MNLEDDFFAELEAEIAAANAATRIKSDIEKNRRKSLNTRLNPDERREAKALFLEAQAILDAAHWHPVASVALFSEQQCRGCGSVHKLFLQYMERQVYTSKSSTRRMIRTTKPSPHLPREVLSQTSITHICADCCEDHGFDLTSATCITASAFAPSPTYEQEDIHAPSEVD